MIYLDHSASTPLDPEVSEAMIPYLGDHFGNPSSVHSVGRAARDALDVARERIAELIGCNDKEIIFTSGGTEADNLAIRGVAQASKDRGNKIVISAIEHDAVRNTCRALEAEGFLVTTLPVDENGRVDPEDVSRAIDNLTVLVSIMHANNEIGTVQPIEEIGDTCRERGVPFHTDAVQALGKVPIDLAELPVDLLCGSAHKMYGPKGAGFLFIRKGTRLDPILFGGPHEKELRAGTENVPGIVGLGKAAELAHIRLKDDSVRIQKLRNGLEKELLERIPFAHVNGDSTHRVAHILNISFPGIDGEAIVQALDLKGIAVSGGSACASGSVSPSQVLTAMGLEAAEALGSVRFSFGRGNRPDEIPVVADHVETIVSKLVDLNSKRKSSPPHLPAVADGVREKQGKD